MPTQSKFYAFDAATGLLIRDIAQAAVTADAYIGTQFDQGGAAATDMIAVINLEAVKISANDETYTFRVTGSNATNRSDAQVLGMAAVGDAGTLTLETVDSAVGDRAEIRFRTEKNGTKFRYIDLHLDVAGTSPSITFNAFFTKEL